MLEGPQEEPIIPSAHAEPANLATPLDALTVPARDKNQKVKFIDPVLKHIDITSPQAEKGQNQQEAAQRIEKEFFVSSVLAKVLASRGYDNNQETKNYIKPSLDQIPDKWTLKNLDKAVNLIVHAIESKQRIAMYCDYDVDGTSAAAILSTLIRDMGGRVKVFTPDRFRDGYGMSQRHAEQVAKDGYDLLVTLDFGTKNKKEIALAQELSQKKKRNLDVVVIDHHEVPVNDPPCEAFVNPMQEGCGYAKGIMVTGGLAYVTAMALKEKLSISSDERLAKRAKEYRLENLLPFAALATVADMGPLIGPNRVLASLGSYELAHTKHEGLRALLNVAAVNGFVKGADIGFALGPRINAAGRIGREDVEGVPGALIAYRLLTARTNREKADELARKLNEFNEERKETQKATTNLAKAEIAKNGSIPPVFVVYAPGLHEGVVGIVAARIMQDYWRPALIVTDGETGTIKGSARSIPGLNITEVFESLKHLLVKAGGHAAAAGLSVTKDKFEEFKLALTEKVAEELKKIDATPYERWDAKVSIAEMKKVGVDLIKEMRLIEPAGRDNPAPQLLIEKARVVNIKAMEKGHTKMLIEQNGEYINAFWWHRDPHPAITVNSFIDVVCQPEIDKKRGQYDPGPQHVNLTIIAAQPTRAV